MANDTPLPLFRRLAEAIFVGLLVSFPYMGAGQLVPPTAAPIATPWDGLIPYLPASVWVYMPGYLLVFLVTVLVVPGARAYRAGLGALVAMTALAVPFFVLYPVAGPRPTDLLGGELTAVAVRALHERDPIGNTFPSLHVANATFCAWLTWKHHRAAGLLVGLLALGVAVSTVTLKQHWLVDIPAGLLLAGVGGWLWRGRVAESGVPALQRSVRRRR